MPPERAGSGTGPDGERRRVDMGAPQPIMICDGWVHSRHALTGKALKEVRTAERRGLEGTNKRCLPNGIGYTRNSHL